MKPNHEDTKNTKTREERSVPEEYSWAFELFVASWFGVVDAAP